MPQTLSAVPNPKTSNQRLRSASRRRASEPRGYEIDEPRPDPADSRISLFPEISVRIPAGKLLALLAALVIGLLVIGHFAQIGAFLSGFIYDPATAGITGDPVITGMVDWLPILLVCVSALVLGSLILNRNQYRRSLRGTGPELVSRPAREGAATQVHVTSLAAMPPSSPARTVPIRPAQVPPDTPRLFLVPSTPESRTPEDRHQAQEQVRLERDARASALVRAAAAARLVISGSVRFHHSNRFHHPETVSIPKDRRPVPASPVVPSARKATGFAALHRARQTTPPATV